MSVGDNPPAVVHLPTGFRVWSRRFHDSITLGVDGELDLATADHLSCLLEEAIRDTDGLRIELDLSGISFVDCAGWHPVAAAGAALEGCDTALAIVACSRAVRRLTDLIGPQPGISFVSD